MLLFAFSVKWIWPVLGYFNMPGPKTDNFYSETGQEVTFEQHCRTAKPKCPALQWLALLLGLYLQRQWSTPRPRILSPCPPLCRQNFCWERSSNLAGEAECKYRKSPSAQTGQARELFIYLELDEKDEKQTNTQSHLSLLLFNSAGEKEHKVGFLPPSPKKNQLCNCPRDKFLKIAAQKPDHYAKQTCRNST